MSEGGSVKEQTQRQIPPPLFIRVKIKIFEMVSKNLYVGRLFFQRLKRIQV